MNDDAVTPASAGDLAGIATILVVEDEAQVRRVIRLTLESQGYRVLGTGDVQQAMRLAAAERGMIDLLIADVVLPGMSGPRLFEKLCSTCGNLHVVYISGYGGEVLAAHGVSDSDANFLAKPFSLAELKLKLHQRLGSSACRPYYRGGQADRRPID